MDLNRAFGSGACRSFPNAEIHTVSHCAYWDVCCTVIFLREWGAYLLNLQGLSLHRLFHPPAELAFCGARSPMSLCSASMSSRLNEMENEGLVVIGRVVGNEYDSPEPIEALAAAVDAWGEKLSLPLGLVYCGTTINWPDDVRYTPIVIGLVTFSGFGDDDEPVAGEVGPARWTWRGRRRSRRSSGVRCARAWGHVVRVR
jgi:hypothetical protein